MKQALSLFSILCIVVLTMTHCKKGDTGPAGPAGSANVTYSDWFTASPWTKDTVFSVYGFNYNKAAPAITQQILDSGAVLTFAKLSGYNTLIWPTGSVGQLPINLTYQSGNTMTDTWSAQATVGNLRIRFVNDKNQYNVISNVHQFRYIIIPGGVKGGRRANLSYEEICREYNIPE